MSDSIRKNAENEIEFKTHAYQQRHGVDYRTAVFAVLKTEPALSQRYSFGSDAVIAKVYDADSLSPAQKAMANLLADTDKTRTLASWTVDALAKQRIRNVGPGVADPLDELRRAYINVRKQFPSLAVAAETGFIDSKDFALLGLLIPSVSGEIERENFSRHDPNRCSCGKNRALCRGEKLARQRRVAETSVAEYSQCIRDAQLYGNELDKILCLY